MQEKISISINRGLLNKVDKLIDRLSVRTRSQAFEIIVRQYFEKEDIGKAVILLGKVQRIDAELLRDHFKRLQAINIKDVIVAAGTQNKEVFKRFGSDFKGLRLSYLREEKLFGTAGAVKALEKDLDKTFLVISGDVKFDFDLNNMLQFHREKSSLVTMCLTSVDLHKSTDNIKVEGDRVTSFEYKAKTKSWIINAAIYLFEPRIFEYLPKFGSLEREVFPMLAKKGLLHGYTTNFSEWSQLG